MVPGPTTPVADPDRLLAAYRAALAQRPLFGPESRGYGAVGGHDEFLDPTGAVRPAWREVAECLADRGAAGLDRLRAAVAELVENAGISHLPPGAAAPQPWRLDAVPLIIAADEWDRLETGLVQRARLLDAVLADLYGPRHAVTSGVLPPQLLFAHPGYVRAAADIRLPGRHQLFLYACDLGRDADGDYRVHVDRTQTPVGAAYALAGRRVVAHGFADLYERIAPRPASPWAQALRLALIDAAPEGADEPTVVVLGAGGDRFDDAYLAGVLGFPLVESADLVVRDGALWMRSLGTLERVDVVLRRVDALDADPLDLRPDSRTGVAGLVEAARRGSVSVVNTLGSGILESPGIGRFLPELAKLLLDEEPLLAGPVMYWGGIAAERSHLLANLDRLVLRPVDGAPAVSGAALSAAQRAELATRIEAEPWRWVGQEPPLLATAPTDCRPGGLTAAAVGLRLFAVAHRGGYVPLVGGLGYVLPGDGPTFPNHAVAAKDVWVRAPARTQVGEGAAPAPRIAPSPTRAVSSPRVLADLFRFGRYAERAEQTARLLTVVRERHHEYRYRQQTPDAACVPVLLAALGRITGTDLDPAGADVPGLLLALTADPGRPGSLVAAVRELGRAARAVRDQMSNDTWMVLAAVERALARRPDPGDPAAVETYLAGAHSRTLGGMLALSGVAAESMVRDVGWCMADIGKRIERARWITRLLGATLTTVCDPAADRVVTEAVLVVCESAIMYRRRHPAGDGIAGVAELVLLAADNPRSLAHQFAVLHDRLGALPGAPAAGPLQRRADELAARLRRVDPADLQEAGADGHRAELAGLLDELGAGLDELTELIVRTGLSVPGHMQPIWGPDERRVLP